MTIFQPNLTFWEQGGHQGIGFQVQSENWVYQADACGRPPSEVQQSIICGTCFNQKGSNAPSSSSYLTGSAGADWDLFSSCCPYAGDEPASRNKTIYYTARNCTSNYCITSDTSLAEGWDRCVKDAARRYFQTTGSGVAADGAYCGRCEYLNHDFLKTGLDISGASVPVRGTFAIMLVALAAIALIR